MYFCDCESEGDLDVFSIIYDGTWQIHVVHTFASYLFQILKKKLSWWFWGRKPTAWGLAVETLWTLLGQKDPASPSNPWGSVKGGQCQGKVTWLEMLWLWHTKVTVSASFCLFKVFMYVHSRIFLRCMTKMRQSFVEVSCLAIRLLIS